MLVSIISYQIFLKAITILCLFDSKFLKNTRTYKKEERIIWEMQLFWRATGNWERHVKNKDIKKIKFVPLIKQRKKLFDKKNYLIMYR